VIRVLQVEHSCLHCGRGGLLEAPDLHRLPPIEPRCEACRGPVLITGVGTQWQTTQADDDKARADEKASRPRPGRPRRPRPPVTP
jgi:hypothetical protein